MKLTIKDLHHLSTTWYAQDINGNLADMTLNTSYMPEYILEDESLYYELDNYMFNLQKEYNILFDSKYMKQCKKNKLDYVRWLKKNYKGMFSYLGDCNHIPECSNLNLEGIQVTSKKDNNKTNICNPKKYNFYNSIPNEKLLLTMSDIKKITIKDVPEKFYDIIPKYKINFENTEIIEDVSKFSLPDSYAKKKYPWLNT